MVHFEFTLTLEEAATLHEAVQGLIVEALDLRATAVAEGDKGTQEWAEGHEKFLQGMKAKIVSGMSRNCQEEDAPMVSCDRCGELYPESELDGLDGELWCIVCDLKGD